MKTSSSARLVLAAMGAAILPPGCVSVGEYEQVKGQLEVEQRKAVGREKRAREIETLAENLRRRLELAELERGEAKARLSAASRALALKPPEGVSRRVGGTAAGAGVPEEALVGTIYFAAGGATVSEKARKDIAQLARRLSGKAGAKIIVCGHSDPTPIERTQPRFESNMHLSAMRALAVYHELVKQTGVDPAGVEVVAYGEHSPAAGSPKKLRRVEIRIRAARSGPAPPAPGLRGHSSGGARAPRPVKRATGTRATPPATRPAEPARGGEPEPWR